VLGINIDMSDAGAPAGKPGVRVVSVSPGGPAEAAGLKANDVLISFNGKPLQGEPGKPAQRELLGNLAQVKVGTSVSVEYRRDDKVVRTQILPKELPQPIEMPVPPNLEGLIDGRAFKFDWRGGSAGLGSADLVELSPALGKYFGTDKGLLVVRAPHDERLKLQDGDVILDIDGRVPSGVAHASQILSSYHAGETLKLHIMRQQKRVELPVEIPAAGEPAAALSLRDLADHG
jgi:S1-C subfamily serine protease